jgi:hypothetical protein
MDLICFICTCSGIFANTIYSNHALHIYFKIFVQICIQIIDLMQNKVHVEASTASEQIFASNVLILAKYFLQNIRFETNNHKTLSKFHIQANICLQVYAYKRIFTCKYSQCITLITFILLQNIRFEAKKMYVLL